jgi:hypothetical protein
MVVLQETTEWPEGQAGNHIYIFKTKPAGRTGDAIAYIPAGRDQVQKFSRPLTLDLRGRTFEEVK